MELIYRIAEIGFDLLQIFIVLRILFRYEINKNKKNITLYVIMLALLILMTEVIDIEILYYNVGLIMCIVFSYMILNKNNHNRFLCTFMSYFIVSALEAIIDFIINSMGNTNLSMGIKTIIINMVAILMMLVLLKIYRLVVKKEYDSSGHKGITIFICSSVILGVMTAMFPVLLSAEELKNSSSFIMFFSLLCFSIVIISIVLLYFVTKNDTYKLRESINSEKIKLLSEYYEDLSRNSEEIRKFRHDYKNHIRSIKYLINNKEYDKLDKYLEDLEYVTLADTSLVNVGNSFVSAILNDYITKAKRDNIEIVVKGIINDDIVISEMDWCIIFNNCLANALEATRKVESEEKRKIYVSISHLRNKTLIEIDNPINSEPVIVNGEMITTKDNKLSHGLGIKNIKNSVERYHGSLNYEMSEDKKSIKTKVILVNINR